ncbi:hypothetical protein NO263_09935 [Gluconacetobacter entanii]|uniref:Glycine-rich domain-containing protein n=3 Tax=Gluconacetobacter entanii TaxID=108528 RepID=A0ABT3K664_9PROT|nr:hypothetical protein [Gluconacetobacter entanii]MCW4590899.1 hypothetical protein [Gluconacetobacter entanii]
MKQSSFPAKFALPFAGSAGAAYIRTIPQASQIGVSAGAASLTDGFPPVTFDPVSAGGTPPSGADMNGILNWVTSVLQAYQSGYFGAWDGTFATSIGGYPMNAIVSGSTAGVYYVSTTDDNMTTPGASGAAWQSLFTGLQASLGFTPVQQGGGVYQAATKVFVGKDSTYSGLRYSYLDPNNSNALTEGGYLVSSYGTILSGSTQVGDLTINSDGRLAFQSVKMADVYTVSANLSDVTAETARAEAAEGSLVSGTLSMATGDSQGQGLHWSGSLGAPMFAYGPGAGSTTVVQVALASQLSGYVGGGLTSGGNYKGEELYLASNGHPTFAYDGGSQQLALPGDIATPMPFASSGTYTVVQGVSRIFFEAVGAGGAGGMSSGNENTESIYAAGGGAGAYARGFLAVSAGDVVTVGIGSGGVSPTHTTGTPTYGGSTTIAINGTVVLTCTGGQSGVWNDVTDAAGGSAGNVTSGSGCTVQLQCNGGFGGDGQSGTNLAKGNGAAGPWGGAGRAGNGGGVSGNGPGAGGGGAYNDTTTSNNYYGGSGGPGYAILTTAP